MDVPIEDWNRFMREAIDEDGFRYPFATMTKKFGRAYIAYAKAAWAAWVPECGTEDDFCKINGGMPKGFFNRVVKTD